MNFEPSNHSQLNIYEHEKANSLFIFIDFRS
jgi:hypothetical protein